MLAVAAIACGVMVGFLYLRWLLRAEREPQEIERQPVHTQDHVLLPAYKRLRSAQEAAVLKRQELELAEKLMRDFGVNENSLMIMGNVLNRHGNATEALEFMNKALKINPRRADIYSTMGWLSIKQGEFHQAIEYYRQALNIQPHLPDTHSNIAHALMILGRHDEAIDELERELQISPDSAFAYFLLGQAYLQQRQYEQAQQNYEAAVKIDPKHAKAYYGLATVCTKLGNRDKAKAYSKKFTQLKAEERKYLSDRKSVVRDDFLDTQERSALTYIEAGQMYLDAGNLRQAEELLKQATGLDPNNVRSFQELASLYQKTNQLSRALQMYKRIGEIEPANPISYAGVGMLSVQLQQIEDAERAFRKLIALAPQNPSGYHHLARMYLASNSKLAEAKRLAEKAVALNGSAANHFVLGLACDKNGDTAGALSAIKRAVELEPGNPQYQQLYKMIRQRN